VGCRASLGPKRERGRARARVVKREGGREENRTFVLLGRTRRLRAPQRQEQNKRPPLTRRVLHVDRHEDGLLALGPEDRGDRGRHSLGSTRSAVERGGCCGVTRLREGELRNRVCLATEEVCVLRVEVRVAVWYVVVQVSRARAWKKGPRGGGGRGLAPCFRLGGGSGTTAAAATTRLLPAALHPRSSSLHTQTIQIARGGLTSRHLSLLSRAEVAVSALATHHIVTPLHPATIHDSSVRAAAAYCSRRGA
jgi:hypothetical protein